MFIVDSDRHADTDRDTTGSAFTADDGAHLTLDQLFATLERLPPLPGYKAEIVEGGLHMTPQSDVHWNIIRRIVRALEDTFGMDTAILSDVRVDFPGALNGFAPDVAKFRAGAEKDASRRRRFQDVEFVAEVLSRNTAALDQGPKKAAYAAAGVPVYLIVDPYLAKRLVCTEPKEGEYLTETRVSFGTALDLTRTPLGLTLSPRPYFSGETLGARTQPERVLPGAGSRTLA